MEAHVQKAWRKSFNQSMLLVLCDGDTAPEVRAKAESLLINFDGVLSRLYERNAMREWRIYLERRNRLNVRVSKLIDYARKNSPTWSEDDEA